MHLDKTLHYNIRIMTYCPIGINFSFHIYTINNKYKLLTNKL